MRRLWQMMSVGLLLAGCSSAPRFTEVSPSTGTYTGGEEIEVRGSNFPRSGVTVRFGAREASSVAIASEQLIKAVSPPGEKGSEVDVTLVFDDGRGLVLRKAFRYVDSSQQRDTMDKFFNEAAGKGSAK